MIPGISFQIVLDNSVISIQRPPHRQAALLLLLTVGLDGGEAEDDGLVVDAEDVEGGLGFLEVCPAGVGDAVEVPGEKEEAEVVRVQRDGRAALRLGRVRQLGDDSQTEEGPVQSDHLLPHTVDGPRPGADTAGVRPVDEDVPVHGAGDLLVNQPAPRLLVVNLEPRHSQPWQPSV